MSLGCDLISIWMVTLFVGSTIDAPRLGLPLITERSVYTKSVGVHATWNCRMGMLYSRVRMWERGCEG